IVVVNGAVPDALAVIHSMRAGFRRCYRKGLQGDPTMKGSLMIAATLGPAGEVLSVSPTRAVGLSGNVIACVAARFSAAQFTPPAAGGAKLTVPLTFQPVP